MFRFRNNSVFHPLYDAVRPTRDCLHCQGTGKSDDNNECGFCDNVHYEAYINDEGKLVKRGE